jgi:hypothetical protein
MQRWINMLVAQVVAAGAMVVGNSSSRANKEKGH